MKNKVLILSIDGGGIRGIIPLKILQLLEMDIQKSTLDTFDMYAGTNTGAIIACALSGLNKSPTQILEDFHDKSFTSHIFNENNGVIESDAPMDFLTDREIQMVNSALTFTACFYQVALLKPLKTRQYFYSIHLNLVLIN